MEILVSKTALLDKLKSVGRIIQPKNTLPAYDNFGSADFPGWQAFF